MSKVKVNGTAFIRHLNLPNGTSNQSGNLFLLSRNDIKYVLKPLPKKPGEQAAKRFIVDTLINMDNKSLIPEFIYPEEIIDIGWKTQYISSLYHPSITLKTLLADSNISEDKKITYLKLVGDVLNRIKLLRASIENHDFAINDLHSDNILIGKKDGELRFCDLDACKIAGSEVFPSMYLTLYYKYLIKHPKKYSTVSSMESDMIYPNENSDIFCYIMMIIMHLYSNFGDRHISEQRYFDFLTFLKSIGVDSELIDIFSKVYTDDDNVNPFEVIESLKVFINNPKVKEFRTAYRS